MSKITHEQAREELRNDDYDLRRDFLFDYIAQQEEQEKLLELYKEHHELKKLEDSTEMIIECLFKTEKCENYHKRIKEIESEIKELEND